MLGVGFFSPLPLSQQSRLCQYGLGAQSLAVHGQAESCIIPEKVGLLPPWVFFFAPGVLGEMSVEHRWAIRELSCRDTTLRHEPFP